MAASGGRMGGKYFHGRERKRSNSTSAPESDSYSVPPQYEPPPVSSFDGFGLVDILMVSFLICIAMVVCVAVMLMFFAAISFVSGLFSKSSGDGTEITTSVVKFQVGLLGLGRSLQSNLNRIAENADTSTPEGMSFVLTDTTLALLRHPDYCISICSSVDMKQSKEDGEKLFNQLSIEERMKFSEETLVNVNNIKMQSTTSKRASGFSNEYIVITILVATEGVHKLPTIKGREDLEEALKNLGSIPSSKVLAVEVLWIPQNENNTLSKQELHKNYPLLRPL